jgi:adenosylcobinamide kinase/adenosylcobinamide-phosphate guanylyltransferase
MVQRENCIMMWTELILGGQKSGKSKRAEMLALDWLQANTANRAILLATAQAHDSEMYHRIQLHQQARSQRVPGLQTVEEPVNVVEQLRILSQPNTLVIVDCLTLMLVNWLMPFNAKPMDALSIQQHADQLCVALAQAQGPIVMVSNEIGLGVIPLGKEVREYVDTLGALNQRIAAQCQRVVFIAAGLPHYLKGFP